MYKCNGCGEEFEKPRTISWGDEYETVCPECGNLDFRLAEIDNCDGYGHAESEHDGGGSCRFEGCVCEMFSAKDDETAEEREEKEEKIRSVLPSKENLAKLLN